MSMFGFENPFKSNPVESSKSKGKKAVLGAAAAAALSMGAASAHADDAIDAMFASKADTHTEHVKQVDVSQKLNEETGQTLEQLMKKNAAENEMNREHNKKVQAEKDAAETQMAQDE